MSTARRTLGRLRLVPVWVWLAAIVLVSAVTRIAIQRQIVAPWIMVDELIYSELAKSFAATGHFQVRGVTSSGYGFVYPVLIAPAWRLFDSIPTAYAAAKAINAFVISLTAVPAYFLARRIVRPPLALVAALLTVLVPSMLYSQMLMTENAFYPVFVLAVLALVLALEQPTLRRQLLLLALVGLAYATRAQAVALVPALLVAPLLLGVLDRNVRRRLREFVPLYAIVGGLAVLALAGTLVRGRSPLTLLGAYRAATDRGYDASLVAHYLLWHVAELDLYLGVIPFAALIALWCSGRSLPPAARAFAAASLPVVVLLVAEVAVFASEQSSRIEERNMFYVAPLAFVALVGVLERVVPRRRHIYAVAATVAAVLPVFIPFDQFITTSAVSDTWALLPWWWVQDHWLPLDDVRWGALVCAVAAAELFFVVPRRLLYVLPAVVGAYFVVSTFVVQNGRHGNRVASVGSLWAGIKVAHPDWVDRAVGSNANVSFIWSGTLNAYAIWETEFFNRSIHTVYDIGGPSPGGLPETPVYPSKNGRLVDASGQPLKVEYALASSVADIEGTLVAHDPVVGLQLVRVDGPLVVQTKVTGIYADPGDTWSGRRVRYTRFDCTGGRLTVELQSDPQLYTSPQIVTATAQGKVIGRTHVPPTGIHPFVVPLRPDARHRCEVTYTMARTLVPAEVDPSSTDTRPLGSHFVRFTYHQ